MSNRSSAQRAAKLLVDLTGWDYEECLRLTNEKDADGIEAYAQVVGEPIDKKAVQYVAWRKRAARAVEHVGD